MNSDEDSINPEVLREASRASREVLDRRIDLVSEMDTIAMHAVRTSVVLIGILVSAAGISGPEAISRLSIVSVIAFGLGGGFLVLTIFYGVAVLTVSEYSFGISEVQRDRARTQHVTEIEWYRSMLGGYDQWIEDMRELNRSNANVLLITLLLFISGTTVIALGAAYMVVQIVL